MCFISSIKCNNISNKYSKPIIEELIINRMHVIDKENENKEDYDEYENFNHGICAPSKYCILQYLYQQPNII